MTMGPTRCCQLVEQGSLGTKRIEALAGHGWTPARALHGEFRQDGLGKVLSGHNLVFGQFAPGTNSIPVLRGAETIFGL